jgi:hypothetical protein
MSFVLQIRHILGYFLQKYRFELGDVELSTAELNIKWYSMYSIYCTFAIPFKLNVNFYQIGNSLSKPFYIVFYYTIYYFINLYYYFYINYRLENSYFFHSLKYKL